MTIFNVKNAGDVPYPRHAVVRNVKVGTGALTKGRLYTMTGGTSDNSDALVAAGEASGFRNGCLQALESVPAATTVGTHTVDVMTENSRIILPAKTAGIPIGCAVQYDYSTHNIEPWSVADTDAPTWAELNARIGRVFEIQGKDTITDNPQRSAVGDSVVVRLGVF